MKIVCDLDGTLCSTVGSDYASSQPHIGRIDMLNSLGRDGHTIIIYTARGMSRFRGIRILALIRFSALTKRQLRTWGLNYDRLILGKPSGDLYIDDKAIRDTDFFNLKQGLV